MTEVTLNIITSTIKSSKNTKHYDVKTNRFLQSYDIPENIASPDDIMECDGIGIAAASPNNILQFVKDEIMEIPAYFSDFLDLNQYYIYGCHSYIESLLLIMDSDFKIYNTEKKQGYIEKMQNVLLEALNTDYKKFGYNSTGIKKVEIKEALTSTNTVFNSIVLKYISDNMSINILLINIDTKSYEEFKCHDIDNTKNNIILIRYEDHILPLVHMYGENFTYKDLQKIKLNFKVLKTIGKISSYTMPQLCTLAEENKISIYNNTKKKLKAELYADIKAALA
jgi:hypothetical protein